jgi:hypothetical protein
MEAPDPHTESVLLFYGTTQNNVRTFLNEKDGRIEDSAQNISYKVVEVNDRFIIPEDVQRYKAMLVCVDCGTQDIETLPVNEISNAILCIDVSQFTKKDYDNWCTLSSSSKLFKMCEHRLFPISITSSDFLKTREDLLFQIGIVEEFNNKKERFLTNRKNSSFPKNCLPL